MATTAIVGLSQPEDDDARESLEYFARYLVGLCFCARKRELSGDPNKEIQCIFRSGFVLEMAGKWYWITAGHILESIDAAMKDDQLLVEQFRLLDGFGANTIDKHYIPFDYPGAWRFYENDDHLGLDYGVVELGPIEKYLLERNNILYLKVEEDETCEGLPLDFFFLMGLPEDCVERSIRPIQGGYAVVGKPNPSFIHVEKSIDPPKAEKGKVYSRFVGQLNENSSAGGIDGMSGGPLVGMTSDGAVHRIVGIQSGWLPESRITFACALDAVIPRLTQVINQKIDRK
jgi:hypothetical protein